MSKGESVPALGQMPTVGISVVSHSEDPLVCPPRDSKESTSRTNCNQPTADSAHRNMKKDDTLFAPKASKKWEITTSYTHSSLPCLISGSLTSGCQTTNQDNLTIPGQRNKRVLQRSQASSNDKRYQQNVPTEMSRKQLPSTELSPRKDGKYGWIIVLGAFIVSVIIDGICLSFGIFYSEFLDYFGQGQSKTAWTGSVLSGTYSLLGKQV